MGPMFEIEKEWNSLGSKEEGTQNSRVSGDTDQNSAPIPPFTPAVADSTEKSSEQNSSDEK